MNYGLNNVWQQGDWITRAIVLALFTMSVLSWTVLLYKGVQLARVKRQCKTAEVRFWQTDTLDEAEATLERSVAGNPHRALLDAARDATDGAMSQLERELSHDEWVGRSLRIALHEQQEKLSRGLAILASIGSTAPFVGLFGTVWGIYHALMVIGASGQSSLDKVAGPVGESLVMTAFGLFVAIPAVLSYNALARGNRAVTHQLQRFAHELHIYFVSGAKHKPATRTVTRTRAASAAPISTQGAQA